MRKCIYCLKLNENKKGFPHAYPESLGQNNLILDSGVICDKCNNYFSGLESSLVAHPELSFYIQNLGLPGRKGKPRKKLGHWKREQSNVSLEFDLIKHVNTVTITTDSPTLELTNEVYNLSFILDSPSGFNQTEFSRALHYIAFNLLAYRLSADYVLASKFDPVRKYIRCPKKNEFWPYYTLELNESHVEAIRKKVKQIPIGTARLQLAGLPVLFFLTLLNDKVLADWLKQNIPATKEAKQGEKPQVIWSLAKREI